MNYTVNSAIIKKLTSMPFEQNSCKIKNQRKNHRKELTKSYMRQYRASKKHNIWTWTEFDHPKSSTVPITAIRILILWCLPNVGVLTPCLYGSVLVLTQNV